MSCYHPWYFVPDLRYPKVVPETGEVKFKYRPLEKYNPKSDNFGLRDDGIKVPCGKCLGCKLDYSRSWADRMILELQSNDGKGIFVTLTYNNDHVPFTFDEDFPDVPNGFSLCKRDLQLFFKRLRKRFPDKTIRYYACGEYGHQTQRPHYHCIIFGLSLDDFPDRRIVGCNELGQDYFTSDNFQRVWSDQDGFPIGFVCLSDVSYKTCAYVSRYCAKKIFHGESTINGTSEFTLMSRRPGLGSWYFDDHPDVIEKKHIYLSDSSGSVKVSVPKYYLQKLKLTNRKLYDKLIFERKQFALDRDLLKLQGTSLSYIDQLELEEEALFKKTQILFNRKEV